MIDRRLRYRIADWHRASECLSNNSKLLKISVSDLLDGHLIRGVRVSVIHQKLGVLFAAVVKGEGKLLSEPSIPLLSTQQVLDQLSKFGFLITYKEEIKLPEAQLNFLAGLKALGYDKITHVIVKAKKNVEDYIVAFNSIRDNELLKFGKELTETDFISRVKTGRLFNISASCPQLFSWWWLTYVAGIQDILDSNKEEVVEEFIKPEKKEEATYYPPTNTSPDNDGLHIFEDDECGDYDDDNSDIVDIEGSDNTSDNTPSDGESDSSSSDAATSDSDTSDSDTSDPDNSDTPDPDTSDTDNNEGSEGDEGSGSDDDSNNTSEGGSSTDTPDDSGSSSEGTTSSDSDNTSSPDSEGTGDDDSSDTESGAGSGSGDDSTDNSGSSSEPSSSDDEEDDGFGDFDDPDSSDDEEDDTEEDDDEDFWGDF